MNCLSRVHLGLILKAFQFGADGVMLLGCEQGRCRFGADSEHIINEYLRARSILEMLGMSKGRLVLAQLPAFDGRQFVRQVMSLIEEIEEIRALKHARVMGLRPVPDIKVQPGF